MRLSRRQFLQRSGCALAVSAAAEISGSQAKPSERPNILFIMTDQQTASMMRCAGNRWVKTPALDSLAQGGVRFEKAYSCNPVCLPNRYSLQTGRMPSTAGIGRNEDGRNAQVPDSFARNSLGPLLKKAGYETVYGGKVHLPPALNPRKTGYKILCRDSRADLAARCADYIKKPHTKPFFLFASFINPHDICYMGINAYRKVNGQGPIENFDSRTMQAVLNNARESTESIGTFVEKDCPPLPANYEIPENEPECITVKYTGARSFRKYIRDNWPDEMWRLHRWAYCRLTEMVDKKIGQVLSALKEAGLEKNTLVVFTSDHGDMDASHRLEHKSVLYEEAVNIPFIMKLPGRIPAGAVDRTHLVSNGFDLLPTLCDYAGVKPPAGLEGKSVRPLAEGRDVPWRDCVFAESQNGRMVRSKRFKYNLYDSGRFREQLIDLENDPGELQNLASDPKYRQVLREHRKLLADWVVRTGDAKAKAYLADSVS